MNDSGDQLDAAALERAGLYDPAASDAAERLALLEYLVDIGATLDDFALVGADEPAVLSALIGLFPEREVLSVDEAAARAGTTPEFVRRVWRAAGFPDVVAGEPVLFASTVDIFSALSASFEFFGEEATMQFVRLLGTAAAKLADAAVSLFIVNAAPGAIERDPSLVELARANAEAVAFVPVLVAGFDLLFRHHLHAARRIIADVVLGVEIQRRTIGFVDLVDSSELAANLTPHELATAFDKFDATVTDLIVARGGRFVKLIGDEVMFSASQPDLAVEIALSLIDAFAAHAVLPPVRAGVATGDVVIREGDYAGAIVNLAARVVKIARPGSLLVDRDTSDALDVPTYRVEPVGDYSVKGFSERVPLFAVTRSG